MSSDQLLAVLRPQDRAHLEKKGGQRLGEFQVRGWNLEMGEGKKMFCIGQCSVDITRFHEKNGNKHLFLISPHPFKNIGQHSLSTQDQIVYDPRS